MAASTISLATMAVAAAGSLIQGASQASQAKRAGKVADANAEMAESQGAAEASLIREKARRLAGSNRAAIGASGVDISGSFFDALQDSDIASEMDAQTTAYNSKVQANNFRAQGKADRASGSSAMVGGVVGAGTKALQGYGNWRLLKTQEQT
jgi:hypothetical protein